MEPVVAVKETVPGDGYIRELRDSRRRLQRLDTRKPHNVVAIGFAGEAETGRSLPGRAGRDALMRNDRVAKQEIHLALAGRAIRRARTRSTSDRAIVYL